MTAHQPKLTGTSVRAKRGRHRRVQEALAKYVRETLGTVGTTPVVEAELTRLLGLADELDRMELDPDRSAHTYATLARTYDDIARKTTARVEHVSTGSPVADALAAAIEHASTS